ncbi:acyl-CoA thioesterase [Alishewanella sp. 16-MA]|uniref:Acyl-CoA thioesterase n=1 Tax=Alishewanella maricola TaxID=2795740 RepID=A0ABS8C710_9ALTE|nr:MULTISPECIES: acyl-CoA thioesterase [Gammaproteobacteria]MDP5035076.1 acyl-CoA thioesterase [Alishewanella sp.]MCB5228138.1 acyl-CoA thioesterase [Alishewanella maricola]MCC5451786.1 acyl-CoA thioesterase [Rheinheimera sp. UJ51]MCF4009607.1 acyl-CoA thioesterase [Rheinheimera sp. UJ63]MDP5185586.1 acyl-CoA thioesterase [Alishewanella sp.]
MSNEALIIKRMEYAVTRVTKTVFPGRTNHHNTLFGGEALAWMDEAAFIAATRFCRKPLVTVCSDRVDFKESIAAGDIVELVARVAHVGRTSIKVQVDIFVENMYNDNQHKAISGSFTFVALDEDRKPTPVLG